MKDNVLLKIIFLVLIIAVVFLMLGGLRNFAPVYYSFLNDEDIAVNLNKIYAKADKKTEGIIRFPDMRCFSRNADNQKNIVWKYQVGNKLKEMISPRLKENLKIGSARNICRQSDYNYLLGARKFRLLIEYYDAEKNFLFSVPITSKECSTIQSMPKTRPELQKEPAQKPKDSQARPMPPSGAAVPPQVPPEEFNQGQKPNPPQRPPMAPNNGFAS